MKIIMTLFRRSIRGKNKNKNSVISINKLKFYSATIQKKKKKNPSFEEISTLASLIQI